MVSISACVSERLFANFSVCPSSNHGGMARCCTMRFMAFAHGLACFVGQQRERRTLARTVAGLAMLLHNGRDIFRKGDVGASRSGDR